MREAPGRSLDPAPPLEYPGTVPGVAPPGLLGDGGVPPAGGPAGVVGRTEMGVDTGVGDGAAGAGLLLLLLGPVDAHQLHFRHRLCLNILCVHVERADINCTMVKPCTSAAVVAAENNSRAKGISSSSPKPVPKAPMSALDDMGTSASAAAVFSSPLAIWVPATCTTQHPG